MSITSVVDTGSTSTATTTTSSTDSSYLDQADFLTLLTTQIQYQDPLDPYDSDSMTEQMTQYSLLEEQGTTNELLTDMMDQLTAMSTVSSVSYIGRELEATGANITVSEGEANDFTYTLGDDADKIYLNIYNSDGEIVRTTAIEDKYEGEYTFTWDGKSTNGSAVDDGTYTAEIYAYDANGSQVTATLSSAGTVTAVGTGDDGLELTLDDGRVIGLSDIIKFY